MSKHTPGPWILDEKFNNPELLLDGYHAITAGIGIYKPEEDWGFELVGFISEANAKLIAAAPTMLEVLQAIDKEARDYTPNGDIVLPSSV